MYWGDKKGEGINCTSRTKHKLESLGVEDIWDNVRNNYKKFRIRIRKGMLIMAKCER
jgi:hypothetical protein